MYTGVRTCRLLILSLLLCANATAGIKFDLARKSPDAQPVAFAGKKVAVLIMSPNRAARRAAEEFLAKEITVRGAEGVAAHILIPESDLQDKEKAKSLLQEAGVVGAVVIRPLAKGGVSIGPDMWKDPQYESLWGFYGESWRGAEDSAKAPSDLKILVETLVYSLEQDTLLWIGTSQTKASKLDEFIHELVGAVAEEMRKEGLLQ